jgi:N-acetylmuramoyl-L-alanine amidase
MKVGDFLVLAFEGSADTYTAEIVSVDAVNAFFTCRRLDTGDRYTIAFSYTMSGPWQGTDDQGAGFVTIDTHDIYTPWGTDPSPQEMALVTFGDGGRYLGLVESISPETKVVFGHPPYSHMSLDGDVITASDWPAYPVGDQIQSIETYKLDNDLVPPVVVPVPPPPTFTDGWWSLAVRRPGFPGRIGGPIVPFAVVVHTTDMMPDTWDGLLHRWTTELGRGECAHFIIGRDAAHGIVQLGPITNDAHHAEGPGHGWFFSGAQVWQPNSVSVGIEIHCAGLVQQVAGAWRLIDGGVIQPGTLPDADVIPDPHRPGRGWHRVTDYQYQQLGALLDGLEAVLAPLPDGCVAHSIEAPPAWGVFATGRRVGHVSLHAADRNDPWPPTCDWIRAR